MNCGRMTPQTAPHGAWLISTAVPTAAILANKWPCLLVTPFISALNVEAIAAPNYGHTIRPTTLHGLQVMLPRAVIGAILVRACIT